MSSPNSRGYTYKSLPEILAARDAADKIGRTAREVLSEITIHQVLAAEALEAYQQTIHEFREAARLLINKELIISGTLSGRGATVRYGNEPDAQVQDLAVRVGNAHVVTPTLGEYTSAIMPPYVDITAWTTDGSNEMVSAGLHPQGVTALSREEWEAEQSA
ncbi:MAG TPA: hypothetical protein VK978_02010 [Candidatus Saccharimonadales bacterium]|nr:hypothetical protein [Candidatus Saccharimonadales bacterium]